MVRSTLRALLTIAGLITASPALAQFPNIFDTLFGNPPQRPPADVPSRPPSQPRYIPPPGGGGLPPGPPPSSRIQTQPLPPPPGAASAPSRAPAPQQATPGAPPAGSQRPQPASLPPPSNETVVEPPPNKIANPTAVFSGLDKITGRIISFDVAINETVRFGALEVTPRACYSRPPTEASATDGFIEVDELTLQGEIKRIFSGWMFAASPGLNAVEHPIYDVWLTDCKGAPQPTVAEVPAAPAPAPARTQQRTPQQQQLQQLQQQQRRSTQLPPPPPPAR